MCQAMCHFCTSIIPKILQYPTFPSSLCGVVLLGSTLLHPSSGVQCGMWRYSESFSPDNLSCGIAKGVFVCVRVISVRAHAPLEEVGPLCLLPSAGVCVHSHDTLVPVAGAASPVLSCYLGLHLLSNLYLTKLFASKI